MHPVFQGGVGFSRFSREAEAVSNPQSQKYMTYANAAQDVPQVAPACEITLLLFTSGRPRKRRGQIEVAKEYVPWIGVDGSLEPGRL